MDAFAGEGLTRRMMGSGCEHREGEDDWAFRQRIFVWMYPRHPIDACEFLLGAYHPEWLPAHTMLIMTLNFEPQTEATLRRFADGFRGDPAVSCSEARQWLEGLEGGEEQH